MVLDAFSGGWVWPGDAMLQFPEVQDIRKPIKTTPIHYLQVGSLEDRWFLTHFLEVGDGLVMPCFNFQKSKMSEL